ncbi:hypothetical protein EV2_038987 [Malus domestica]
MSDKLAEIGQRLELIKSNTFENILSTGTQINREEEDDQSSRSASVGAYSEHSNSEQEQEMADNDDDYRALEDYAQPVASLEKKLDSMLNMVPKIAEVCAICNIPGHPTYQCSGSEAYP